MLENVRDMIERYGRHPAFAGLAIQLSSVGYAQLPPLEWGLDDTTFARFARDKGIQLPDDGPDRFDARYKLLTGPQAAAWRSWRTPTSQRILRPACRAYSRQQRPSARTDNRKRVRRSATRRTHASQSNRQQRRKPASLSTLIDAGIDRESLERLPGVVLVRHAMSNP